MGGDREKKSMTEYISRSYEDTIAYGNRIGSSLTGGEVIILTGALGSGKTALTKGIALGLGIGEVVTSPSFSIMNEYEEKLWLYHFDFYRISKVDEMEELVEDYLYKKNGVVVIEWGEEIIRALDSYLWVHLKIYAAHRLIYLERRSI